MKIDVVPRRPWLLRENGSQRKSMKINENQQKSMLISALAAGSRIYDMILNLIS